MVPLTGRRFRRSRTCRKEKNRKQNQSHFVHFVPSKKKEHANTLACSVYTEKVKLSFS